MTMDWFIDLTRALSEITGTQHALYRSVVPDFIAIVIFFFLFIFSRIRYSTYRYHHEYLLVWGYGIGLIMSISSLTLTMITFPMVISEETLILYRTVIYHSLWSLTLLTVTTGWGQLLCKSTQILKRYFQLGLTSVAALFLVMLLRWKAHPVTASPFEDDWPYHLLNLFWLTVALFSIRKPVSTYLTPLVYMTIGLLMLSEGIRFSSSWTNFVFEQQLYPLGGVAKVLALLFFAYTYIKACVHEHIHDSVELSQGKALLSGMFEVIHAPIWLKDPNGVYLACNKRFESLYGAKESEIVGKTDYDFVDREQADFFRAHDQLAIQLGHANSNEEWLTFADGERALMQTSKTPMHDSAGQLIGVLGIAHDVTVLKQAEAQARQYQRLVSSSHDAIISKSLDGIITSWNQGAEALFGYSAEEVLQQPVSRLYPPDHAHEETNILSRIRQGQQIKPYETVRMHKDGSPIYVSLTVSPIYDSQQNIIGASTIAKDISDRIRDREQISRLTKLYKAVLEINHAIVTMSHEQDLFPLVCRCAVEFGGMEMAWVGQQSKDSNNIQPVAKYGQHLEYLDNLSVTLDKYSVSGNGPAGLALREGHNVVSNQFIEESIDKPWYQNAVLAGWQSVAAFPIKKNGRPYAVFTIYHTHRDVFDEDIITLMDEMAVDISFALDNFERDLQRRLAEESLQLAASIYSATSEAMLITDSERRIVDVNPAFSALTEFTKAEVIGQTTNFLRSAVHDDAIYEAMLAQVNTMGSWQGELWIQKKNEEIFPAWITINSVYHDDHTLKYRIVLFTDISQKKASEELIWSQANLDMLTGLPNRYMFHQRLEQEIRKSTRTGLPLALIFLDLDRFKEVNDTLGHSLGDILLKTAAQRLKECIRATDTVARLGGDEFTIILSGIEDISSVYRVTQAIMTSLEFPFKLEDEIAYISASIGITFYPDDATDVETLLKHADQAMYAAKNAGRNRISFFTKSMQSSAERRMRLTNDLHHALENGEIWLAYQPIIDFSSHEITKAEALVRWTHPEFGEISPNEFIPMAEHTGLIHSIGDWVFHQAMAQVAIWQETYHPKFQITVNKSPVQIQDRYNMSRSWYMQLEEAHLKGHSIVVEITEGLLLEHNDYINQKLLEFRDHGIQVALDDFGTGYSSLSYLQKFDIDYIKIDKEFVQNLGESEDSLALCEAITVMAHKLGIKVIAEGIETEAQKQMLLSIGCDYGQGFYYSKPLPAHQLTTYLDASFEGSINAPIKY